MQHDDEDELELNDEKAFICCHGDRHFRVLFQEPGSTMGLDQTGGS